MNKQQRIEKIEAELAQLKREVIAEQNTAYDGIARNLGEVNFEFGAFGNIYPTECCGTSHQEIVYNSGSGYTSRQAAERALKTRQLTHKAIVAMQADWGDFKCDWGNNSQTKYCIKISINKIYNDYFTSAYQFLAFRTELERDIFRDEHTDEELILIITHGVGL